MATKFIRVRGRVIPIKDKGDVTGGGYHEAQGKAQSLRGSQKSAYVKKASSEYSKTSKEYGRKAAIGKSVGNFALGGGLAAYGASSLFGRAAKSARSSAAAAGATKKAGSAAAKKLISKSRVLGKYGLLVAGAGALVLAGSLMDSRVSRSASSNARNIKKDAKKRSGSSV